MATTLSAPIAAPAGLALPCGQRNHWPITTVIYIAATTAVAAVSP